MFTKLVTILLLPCFINLSPIKPKQPNLPSELITQLKEKPTYKQFDVPDHAIQSLLTTAKITPSKNKNLPADISFICADIKYNNGILKFCECGNAVYMSPTTTSQVKIDDISYTVTAPYWGIFWHYLKRFNLPIWFVGKVKDDTVFALEELKKLGGNVYNNLEEVEAMLKLSDKTVTRKDDISEYQGIVVYYSKDSRRRDGIEITEFRNKHSELLYVSYPAHSIVSKKTLTYQLFNQAGLSNYLPKTKIYPNKWRDGLTSDILANFSCTQLIIKPTSLSCSNGIQVTTRDKLYDILSKGLKGTPRQKFNLGFNYWHNQTYFMVSEYIQSKTIYVDNKPYDPTMRVVCALHHTLGTISCLPISCFWKIPTHSLTDKASLNEKHITRAHHAYSNPDIYFSGISLSDRDKTTIEKNLYNIMPKLYQSLLTISPYSS